ncbi:uncharacterized protein Z518_01104 [Rhinocladiella mackenziei CBS 650.93]|uniref:Uncharacterized protein n=1 Tax=Rhinocladiella mackenziei CBS 650.93 TaxID=1442369 RepID=A0A0D2HHC8_9EURO|nr:uncharacterized protein Z518_01104 [Rhinocladiella mackenziei CBS 650.93]KIX10023.1 hypothetical protein Z518_01104 [Rhinocladiella mackenziei CBS 650.93]
MERANAQTTFAFVQGYSIAPIASILTDGGTRPVTVTMTLTATTALLGSLVTITTTSTADATTISLCDSSQSGGNELTAGLGDWPGVGFRTFLLFQERRHYWSSLKSLPPYEAYGTSADGPVPQVLAPAASSKLRLWSRIGKRT